MSSRRLRVLFLASHPVQYQAPLFRRLADCAELDIHVAYCSLRGAKPAVDPEFNTTVQWDLPLLEGYPWTELANRGSGAETFFGLRNPGIWNIVRAGKFDALLSLVGYVRATFWIAYAAAKLSNTAFLFGTDAISLSSRDGSRWKAIAKRVFWPALFRLANQIVVPSSGSRDLLISLGLPSERVTLTPYTVDNDWWMSQASRADRAALRASWGASSATSVILFSAKLQPWKRPFDLLHAFAKANLSDSILIFAGEGPLRSRLESEAVTLGLGSRVHFLGFVNQSQLPAIYGSANLMVLPSEYEPFAVVVNEAICCGCPVAASEHVGAARDLIRPIAPDFIFPCGDVDALATLLGAAIGDRMRLESVARAAQIHIQKYWSPEKNISETIRALRAAVNAPASDTQIANGKKSI